MISPPGGDSGFQDLTGSAGMVRITGSPKRPGSPSHPWREHAGSGFYSCRLRDPATGGCQSDIVKALSDSINGLATPDATRCLLDLGDPSLASSALSPTFGCFWCTRLHGQATGRGTPPPNNSRTKKFDLALGPESSRARDFTRPSLCSFPGLSSLCDTVCRALRGCSRHLFRPLLSA